MGTSCRGCREDLAHCHGTVIRHALRRPECTDDGCDDPELIPHTFVIECDMVGCGCGEPVALAAGM
ncbi:hypothetical protein [Mycobacterium botniense]|uniref:Uncharacterized protein n=1 Tax=Mycobacterium botniense TaxID=84962 RepID=A0A7I9XV03_9MYCO|nr:hypothetical protein [Mycobacterium botniense]GFG72664.1 hypothetical protein MBOT_00290 [Mycobacterium botniense]GFG73688.1 hypothetical protein MBOT_10530 [Mycobacterium botniense]